MGYVIGVSHCKADPRRVDSLKRLGIRPDFIEDTPGHHSVWAPKMWRTTGAIAHNAGASHCVFLQDDVTVHGDFPLREDVVCLHTPHPRFKAAFDAGYSWASSVDGMVGNGYIIPLGILVEFLRFREEEFLPEVLIELNEDAQIGLFCMATNRRIYHPLPSPIDHDTSIPSTWGADGHLHRRPCVPWNAKRGTKRVEGVADIGRIYPKENWRLVTHLKTPMVRRAYELGRL